MSKNKISISPKELNTLVEWLNTFDIKPNVVTIETIPTGVGIHIRAEVETQQGEGRWKDISDYDSW